MGKGKVGAATSTIENTRKVSAIASNYRNCFHSISKDGVLYCKYYDIFSSKKKKCARYFFWIRVKVKISHHRIK